MTEKSHLSHPKYRPDIDGLRAVAVMAVILFHAFPGVLSGGYIGVDVFFVISGFLISTILFENIERGTFSFREFYARRVRRIFPALAAMLASCWVAGWFFLFPDEFAQLGKHIAGGAGFVANFVYLDETGYFDNAAETKPLIHLWSLGIEEQFYILMPLLLVWCWRTNRGFLLIVIMLALASFILNVAYIRSDPEAVFYLPLSRFFELLAGSLLAWVTLRLRDCEAESAPSWWRWLAGGRDRPRLDIELRSLVGLGLIAGAAVYLDRYSAFPGAWALLPVVGTLLVISAGPEACANRVFLASPVAIWIGLISYPLYLWHWPLLSFARIIESGPPGAGVQTACLAASVGLAWLTFKFIEKPLRFNRKHGRGITQGLALVMACLVCIGIVTKAGEGFGRRQIHYDWLVQFEPIEMEAESTRCKLRFPGFEGSCFSSATIESESAPLRVLVIGDSHANALGAGIMRHYPDLAVDVVGEEGCLPLPGIERFNEQGPMGCVRQYDTLHPMLENRGYDIAMMVGRYALHTTGAGFGQADIKHRGPGNMHLQKRGPRLPPEQVDYPALFAEGLRTEIELLLGIADSVVLVHQVPELGFTPRACVPRPLIPGEVNECRIAKRHVVARQSAYRRVAANILEEFTQITALDPMEIFCDDEYCHAKRDGKMLYRDDDHLSYDGAAMLFGALLRRLE